jgi:hypothetical protein
MPPGQKFFGSFFQKRTSCLTLTLGLGRRPRFYPQITQIKENLPNPRTKSSFFIADCVDAGYFLAMFIARQFTPLGWVLFALAWVVLASSAARLVNDFVWHDPDVYRHTLPPLLVAAVLAFNLLATLKGWTQRVV